MIVEAIENYKSSFILHHLEKLVINFAIKSKISIWTERHECSILHGIGSVGLLRPLFVYWTKVSKVCAASCWFYLECDCDFD